MIVCRHYRVSGRVQGVGFRFFAEETALREGISGWVRNGSDGVVEIQAEGEQEAVVRFERAIRTGPRGARVDDVEVGEEAPSGRVTGFAIRG
jgi:acylphosphatase